MASISVVVAVRDEEAMLPGCLRRLSFADEVVVVVDDRTKDNTAELAASAGAVVLQETFRGFGELKNAGLSAATGDWVFVLDADERVSKALAHELSLKIDGPFDAFRVQMANYFHGALMRGGGWQERPTRVWRREWAKYPGAIHERPNFGHRQPRFGQLDPPLVHFSHRTIVDNLRKSANYVEIQAREMLPSGRAVTPRHLYWILLRESLFRLVWRSGWRDGVPGVAESIYWPFSNMAAQVRLWELQQSPSIEEVYAELEDSTW
jgi:glycosyltransferase involved in cell wall biosynthesis